MSKHILRLRYDGLSAEHGEVGTSASKQIVTGAQMFLGAHAHYYLTEHVPDRINDRSPHYEIAHLARERGSHIADFVVNLLSNGIYDAAKLGFGAFLLESYRAWSEKRLYEDPPYERLEPYFDARPSNAPFIDTVEENRRQRERLGQRVGKSMSHMTVPNGTYSSKLEMSIDGVLFATVTRRFFDEEDIAEAVRLIRDGRDGNRRIY